MGYIGYRGVFPLCTLMLYRHQANRTNDLLSLTIVN